MANTIRIGGEEVPLFAIKCECGFQTGIQEPHLEEMASGTWGPVNCMGCHKELNDKIIALWEAEEKKAKEKKSQS